MNPEFLERKYRLGDAAALDAATLVARKWRPIILASGTSPDTVHGLSGLVRNSGGNSLGGLRHMSF